MKTTVALSAAFLFIVSASSASAECPKHNIVDVSSRNGAYDTSIDWSEVKTGLGIKSSSNGRTSFTIYLANFEFIEDTENTIRKLQLAEGQGMLKFVLTRQIKGQKDVAFASGQYDFSKAQGSAEETGSVKIRVPAGKSVSFEYHKTEGAFEVIHVSATEICGKFSLKDRFSEVTGEFSVPVNPR